MDMEKNNLIMVVFMKENGRIADIMERENINSPMETFMKENSKMERRTVMEFTSVQKDLYTEVSGKMIFNMEKVKNTPMMF